MEKIAKKITDSLLENMIITENRYEIYRYGLLIGMEIILCFSTCFFISFCIGMVMECIISLALFGVIRSFVGGIHMKSFVGCFICSCTVLTFILLLTKYKPVNLKLAFILSVCELLVLLMIKPVENKNRVVDELEKKIFMHKIRQIVVLISLIVVVCYMLALNKWLCTVVYTLGAIIISMFLGKMNVFWTNHNKSISN